VRAPEPCVHDSMPISSVILILLAVLLLASGAGHCGHLADSDDTGSTPAASFLQQASWAQHAGKVRHQAADPRDGTYSLFVKFHKVAGTTFRAYVNRMTGTDAACSISCGAPHWICEQEFPPGDRRDWCLSWEPSNNSPCDPVNLRSCTWHASLAVMQAAVSSEPPWAANMSDLAAARNLWPSEARRKWLWNVEWARAWMPANLRQKRLLITTIIRQPMEKMRSWYYFWNYAPSSEGFLQWLQVRRDFVAGNLTPSEFALQASTNHGSHTMEDLLRTCCEYETFLGNGTVDNAKLALATQFDLVGITERLTESLVTLGRLCGYSPHEVAQMGKIVSKEHAKAQAMKLEWTNQELALADFITKDGQAIYAFAQEVFQRRAVDLWGSEAKLKAAAALLEDPNNQLDQEVTQGDFDPFAM